MTRFRPCIDLHAGQVKQIVGGTLTDDEPFHSTNTTSTSATTTTTTTTLRTNHISAHPAGYFASLYRQNDCRGAHVIMLGPGNEEAARQALSEWPGGLQVGGGVGEGNAREWIERGAEKVIVTSYLFPDAKFSQARLDAVLAALGGDRNKLVIDLSCRRRKIQERDSQQADGEPVWVVAMNKWTRPTDMEVNAETIRSLEPYCSEFLIHAADVEGLQAGMDEELIRRLASWCSIPCTYAGGGRTVADLARVEALSGGRVDLTIGSALDVFGGQGVRFEECVAWNRRVEKEGEGGGGK